MPPRIPLFQCLRASNASTTTTSRAFSSTPSSRASTVTQRKRHRDPYAVAQAKARKAANLSRQEVLKKERAAALGDPVRGVTTPFLRSFDDALPPEPSAPSASTKTRIDESPVEEAPVSQSKRDEHLNFFFSKSELESSILKSKWLTQPLEEETSVPAQTLAESNDAPTQPAEDQPEDPMARYLQGFTQRTKAQDRPSYSKAARELEDIRSNSTPELRAKRRKEEHQTAQEAIRRISSLSLGSSKDRLRVNIQRCVDEFGRHNTDNSLPPKPASSQEETIPKALTRVGSDTGSSEVQIAILTAKIRTLADSLELRGTPSDKMNKRNLRLLVHKRAKLLQYLRRKERGGPRWQHLIEKLGLTDGTWKGEISL